MYRLKYFKKLETKEISLPRAERLGIGFEKLDRYAFDPEPAYPKLKKIGIKWVRIQSGWNRTETQKGVYDFSWLDSVVDNLIAGGMTPWICLCYGNGLYGGLAKEIYGAVGCPPIQTDEQKVAWYNYCGAIARHYRDRVKYFEIWNEPDGGVWKYDQSPKSYTQFSINTAKALREANPDVYIIGGATVRINLHFISECFKLGLADYINAISFHAYYFDDRKIKGSVRALRSLINMYNPSIEIIQGESGAQSKPFGHGAMHYGAWTERKQAKYLLRHMITDLGLDVKFTSYFSCLDMAEALNGKIDDVKSYSDFGYFGVLGAIFDKNGVATGEYTEKESYFALCNLAAIFSGKTETVELPIIIEDDFAAHCGNVQSVTCAETEYYGFRLSNGNKMFAYWYPSNFMTTDFEGAITINCADLGDVHLLDPMDGSMYEIPDKMIESDAGGIKLKLLPIRDYPLLLIFGKID